jgi:hypothetical protein
LLADVITETMKAHIKIIKPLIEKDYINMSQNLCWLSKGEYPAPYEFWVN